jgi:hypothetical protein
MRTNNNQRGQHAHKENQRKTSTARKPITGKRSKNIAVSKAKQ